MASMRSSSEAFRCIETIASSAVLPFLAEMRLGPHGPPADVAASLPHWEAQSSILPCNRSATHS
eukprot:8200271-Lingulodinium_polyedra.AAC.1